jgi:RNA polymerase sigma factor (sigma-70 family)
MGNKRVTAGVKPDRHAASTSADPEVELGYRVGDADWRVLFAGLRIAAIRELGDRDLAEDAAQETLWRVTEALKSKPIPAGYTLQTYAHGTLRHVIINERRRRGRFTRLFDNIVDPGRSPLELLVTSERRSLVRRALAALDRKDRELLERSFINGEKTVDIARSIGEQADCVRQRCARAKKKLKDRIAELTRHVRLTSDD